MECEIDGIVVRACVYCTGCYRSKACLIIMLDAVFNSFDSMKEGSPSAGDDSRGSPRRCVSWHKTRSKNQQRNKLITLLHNVVAKGGNSN